MFENDCSGVHRQWMQSMENEIATEQSKETLCDEIHHRLCRMVRESDASCLLPVLAVILMMFMVGFFIFAIVKTSNGDLQNRGIGYSNTPQSVEVR